jgi:hypothetical protein
VQPLATASTALLQTQKISSAELFEEKFRDFDEEWQHLSTLKLVFDRFVHFQQLERRSLHAVTVTVWQMLRVYPACAAFLTSPASASVCTILMRRSLVVDAGCVVVTWGIVVDAARGLAWSTSNSS